MIVAQPLFCSLLRIMMSHPESKDESSGRTRTSHPGEQGRVIREDKDESSGNANASRREVIIVLPCYNRSVPAGLFVNFP